MCVCVNGDICIIYTHILYLPSTLYATHGYTGHYIQQPYYNVSPSIFFVFPKQNPLFVDILYKQRHCFG